MATVGGGSGPARPAVAMTLQFSSFLKRKGGARGLTVEGVDTLDRMLAEKDVHGVTSGRQLEDALWANADALFVAGAGQAMAGAFELLAAHAELRERIAGKVRELFAQLSQWDDEDAALNTAKLLAWLAKAYAASPEECMTRLRLIPKARRLFLQLLREMGDREGTVAFGLVEKRSRAPKVKTGLDFIVQQLPVLKGQDALVVVPKHVGGLKELERLRLPILEINVRRMLWVAAWAVRFEQAILFIRRGNESKKPVPYGQVLPDAAVLIGDDYDPHASLGWVSIYIHITIIHIVIKQMCIWVLIIQIIIFGYAWTTSPLKGGMGDAAALVTPEGLQITDSIQSKRANTTRGAKLLKPERILLLLLQLREEYGCESDADGRAVTLVFDQALNLLTMSRMRRLFPHPHEYDKGNLGWAVVKYRRSGAQAFTYSRHLCTLRNTSEGFDKPALSRVFWYGKTTDGTLQKLSIKDLEMSVPNVGFTIKDASIEAWSEIPDEEWVVVVFKMLWQQMQGGKDIGIGELMEQYKDDGVTVDFASLFDFV